MLVQTSTIQSIDNKCATKKKGKKDKSVVETISTRRIIQSMNALGPCTHISAAFTQKYERLLQAAV